MWLFLFTCGALTFFLPVPQHSLLSWSLKSFLEIFQAQVFSVLYLILLTEHVINNCFIVSKSLQIYRLSFSYLYIRIQCGAWHITAPQNMCMVEIVGICLSARKIVSLPPILGFPSGQWHMSGAGFVPKWLRMPRASSLGTL